MKPNSRLDRFLDRTVLLSYTSIGYALRKSNFSPLPPLEGQRVVVTGATSGLGFETAWELSARGAQVVMVARNEKKAIAARDDIIHMTARENVSIELADLSLMEDTRDLAARLGAGPPIDVLVNNAGVLVADRTETAEGIELTLATNLLSHYLLTEMLAPDIKDGGRIINVSSGGMYSARIRPEDLQFEVGEYTGLGAFARTKRGQVILSEIWAEQLAPRQITVSSMHPGWSDTPGVVDALPRFSKVIGPILRAPHQGADTILWLASTDEPVESGKFWHDRTSRPTHLTDRTKESPKDRQALLAGLRGLAGL